MPAPTAASMKALWKASYTYPTTNYTEEYTQKLFSTVEKAWNNWEKGFSFGGLTASGAGLGGWTGSGGGGTVIAQPYQAEVFIFYQQTKQQEKFQNTLYQTIAATLAELAAGIKFTTVVFTGASTASPTSPGVFTAQVAQTPLVAASSKSTISGIGNRWKAQLLPPDFNLSHPQCAATSMVQAVADAIEKSFTLWAAKTCVTGSTVFGAAAPGAGTGAGTSQFDGILV